MAVQNFEILNSNTDVTTTRTLLHEAIPVTGAIVSGTYNDENIKNYTHGQFQSVYDYPYLSSSANHILDLTVGYDESSGLSGSGVTNIQNSKKINMYNQEAQVLLGYTGSSNAVEIFESDLNISDDNNQMKECFFVNFSRLLTKDQIKPGSFSCTFGVDTWSNPMATTVTLTDASASTTGEGTAATQGGDYGVLYQDLGAGGTAYGIIFYQSGIAILSASYFDIDSDGKHQFYSAAYGDTPYGAEYMSVTGALSGAAISASCDAFRHRWYDLSYNNTTEINSTIYFCRAPYNKFNYSSNPTYTSGSKIRVKSVASDTPISYITTIGLYNAANELLAVAKLSEPLAKTPANELTLRVRLDY